MTLSFVVEKQSITRTDTETPATNSIRYLKAKFEFGDNWNTEHNICPRFRIENEDTVYVPPLINGKYLNEAGTCFVPIELLQNAGRFLVSVIDETNGVCITTAETYVTVVKGSGGMYSPSIQSLDLNYDDKNEILQLTANGVPVGTGVELPVAAPWAKQITYERNKTGLRFTVENLNTSGNYTAMLTVAVPVEAYTRNETEILSVTPLLPDYRGIRITTDETDSNRTAVSLLETYADVNEAFFVDTGEDVIAISISNVLAEAKSFGAIETNHAVSASIAETSYSDGTAELVYAYAFYFNESALRDAFAEEFLGLIKEYAKKFTVQFNEISYVKEAEVLQ